MPRLALALALLASAASSAAPKAERRIAVLPFRPLGIAPERAESLTALFRGEVARLEGVSLLGASVVDVAIPKVEGCGGKQDCLARTLRGIGADALVLTTAGGLGDTYVLDITLIDTAGREGRRISQRLGGAEAVLIEGSREAAVQLLAPQLWIGSLLVKTSAVDAEVQVDGKPVGKTPLKKAVAGVQPGERALRIVKTGYKPFEQFVEIRFGQTTIVNVDLDNSSIAAVLYAKDQTQVPFAAPMGPDAPAPHPFGYAPSWIGPSSAGVATGAVLALGVGLYYGLQAKNLYDDLDERYQKKMLRDGDDALYRDYDDFKTRANALFIVSGLLAALGTVGLHWAIVAPSPAPGGGP